MEIDEAVRGRRSVRKYLDKPVPTETVREILEAGTWAPSARNRQMWRFTVLTGDAKKKLTDLFRSKLETRLKRVGRGRMGSSFMSCVIMEHAPVLIMVWDADHPRISKPSLQSVAAAIQNMLLKAHSLGLGSLWICDIYFASNALTKHLGKPWKLMAAVTLGWPAEVPTPKPRKSVDEVSEFLS
jgi:nitroreductase